MVALWLWEMNDRVLRCVGEGRFLDPQRRQRLDSMLSSGAEARSEAPSRARGSIAEIRSKMEGVAGTIRRPRVLFHGSKEFMRRLSIMSSSYLSVTRLTPSPNLGCADAVIVVHGDSRLPTASLESLVIAGGPRHSVANAKERLCNWDWRM
jgi:hypothetical protein